MRIENSRRRPRFADLLPDAARLLPVSRTGHAAGFAGGGDYLGGRAALADRPSARPFRTAADASLSAAAPFAGVFRRNRLRPARKLLFDTADSVASLWDRTKKYPLDRARRRAHAAGQGRRRRLRRGDRALADRPFAARRRTRESARAFARRGDVWRRGAIFFARDVFARAVW